MARTSLSSGGGRTAPGAFGLKLERVAFAVGLGLFLWLLHRIGLPVVAQNLTRVGWGFAIVLVLELAPLLLLTWAWRCTLPREARVPFRRLLAMRLAGDAINVVAPVAVVGGEILRARLLASFLPASEAVASVALAAATQFLAQILYVGIGSMALPEKVLRPGLRFVGPAAAVLLVLLAWSLVARRRLKGPAGRNPAPWPWMSLLQMRSAKLGSILGLLGNSAAAIARGGQTRLALSVLLFLGGWSVGAVEVALILRLLGSPVLPRTALSISVMVVFVEGVLFFVPLRAGVTEGGLYTIFLLLGLDPAKGFSLAIVRRLRELVWALIGLAILGIRSRAAGRQAGGEPVPETDRSRP